MATAPSTPSSHSRSNGHVLPRSRFLFLSCCFSLFSLFPCGAQAPTSTQYKLEAVFLFNFTQFIEWPATAFPKADSPFIIGVLGNDPFGSILDGTVRGETAKGRPIVVQRYRNTEEIKNCQILFISSSEAGRLKKILASLKGMPVLTVGESENFARNGGAVRFLTAQPKIGLRINIDTLSESQLAASSKLLRLAEIVHTNGK
jgi:hypothetical protein